jgi:hypothetical protein
MMFILPKPAITAENFSARSDGRIAENLVSGVLKNVAMELRKFRLGRCVALAGHQNIAPSGSANSPFALRRRPGNENFVNGSAVTQNTLLAD